MPAKYVIHTEPVENRFKPLSKSGILAWEEGCLKCPVCVQAWDRRKTDAGFD
ncbi:MAG: hypothetical protein JRJ13_06665 [Deltaproteobacteria bacterium]|nr:hypothetical protein [Deltaproteobacteria bacterium]